MSVFVTEKARMVHWQTFKDLTEDFVAELEPVEIPDGANEVELWELFQVVVDSVSENEDIIFDITHGFRSLPFLSFLAAAYLQAVKQINLHGLLYGNFEARDTTVQPNRAPVIDLTEFVSLLDWMIAADRFVRFGDAHDLAAQLQKTKPDYRTADQTVLSDWSKSTGIIISSLQQVSQSLRLLRPYDAMAGSATLRARLQNATADVAKHPRPFQILSRQIIQAYAPLAVEERQLKEDVLQTLAVERDLVHWYLKRNQLVQATAIAREWVISWFLICQSIHDILNRTLRHKVEKSLGEALQAKRQGDFQLSQIDKELAIIPNASQAIDLYNELGTIRNDLMHAGKRKDALPGKKLEKRIRQVCSRLDELVLPQAGP